MNRILNQKIDKNQVGIWWLGQTGYVFKSPGNKIFCLDPYLSNLCAGGDPNSPYSRMFPVPISPDSISADVFIFSHDHADHLDPETIKEMSENTKQSSLFCGTRNVCKHLKRTGVPEKNILELFYQEEVQIEGMKILPLFSLATDESDIYHCGFLFTFENGLKFYYTGDTSYCSLLSYIGKYKPDLAFVCINGKWNNLDVKEAVEVTKKIMPKAVIPMHYGLFPGNTVDPEEFADELKRQNTGVECNILQVMRPYIFQK